MDGPRIAAVSTALPERVVSQEEAEARARQVFGDEIPPKFFGAYANAGVELRHFAADPRWLVADRSFGEKNDLYIRAALELSEKAARRALARAEVEAEELAAVVFASSSGFAVPTLDGALVRRLGVRADAWPEPLVGFGCAAGARGLARAARYVRADGGPVLLVVAELSSLTFRPDDHSPANVVSAALFGDGVAAAVVVPDGDGDGPEVIGDSRTLWPDREDLMGWRVDENGLSVRLSPEVPEFVATMFPPAFADGCRSVGADPAAVRHHLMHPGGARVLDALEDALGLAAGGLRLSREVLRENGNMSAVTVLAILERFLARADYSPGDLGVVSAMGPGFRAEHVFFRC